MQNKNSEYDFNHLELLLVAVVLIMAIAQIISLIKA